MRWSLQRTIFVMAVAVALAGALPASGAEAASQLHSDVFGAFTAHIQRQVVADKRGFAEASECTQWFYKQERKPRPQRPRPQGVRFESSATIPGPHRAQSRIDCEARFPGGLTAAREAFGRAQSILALSLTFYEFALVGDRDDDQRYSEHELRDIMESFGLTFNPGLPNALQVSTLNGQFDSIHRTSQFDLLMSGMSKLFDQGYRFSFRDKEALNRLMG